MTVREIFELRKEGRIEEAYDAIRPMYAAHKGKYTSICMFWTASDIFKLRLEQKRYDEARQIFQALKRMLPYVEDKEGKAAASIQNAARRLSRVTANQTTDAKKNPSDSITSIPSNPKEEKTSITSIPSSPKEEKNSITSSPKEEKTSITSIPSSSKKQADSITSITSIPSSPKEEKNSITSIPSSPKEEKASITSITSSSKKQADSITSITSSSKEEKASITSITSSPKEEKNSITSIPSSPKEEKTSSVIEEDLAGHLVVGLDEGMNRPAEGIINARQRVLDYIRAHEGCSVSKITIALTIPAKSVERHVAALVADELVEHRGSKKTGGYYAINAKNQES